MNFQALRKFYIVQYQNEASVRQAIVAEGDLIISPRGGLATEEVFVMDGPALRLARLLYIGEQIDEVRQQFQVLKVECCKMMFKTAERAGNANEWLLLQYNDKPDSVVYEIASAQSTSQCADGVFHSLITFTSVGGSLKQALILDRSGDVEKLHQKLYALARESIKMVRPKGISNAPIEVNEPKDPFAAHIAVLEKTMQAETAMISEAFAAVDAAKSHLKQELDFLNGLADK